MHGSGAIKEAMSKKPFMDQFPYKSCQRGYQTTRARPMSIPKRERGTYNFWEYIFYWPIFLTIFGRFFDNFLVEFLAAFLTIVGWGLIIKLINDYAQKMVLNVRMYFSQIIPLFLSFIQACKIRTQVVWDSICIH